MWLCHDFRKTILDIRRGNFRFDRKIVPIGINVGVAGAIISNSIFLYFISIFVFTFIFSILAWPMTYIIAWNLRWTIFSIIVAYIINYIQGSIIGKLLYEQYAIKRRLLLSVFDFLALQVSILAGIIAAIKRVLYLTLAFFASIMRIDVSSLPDWILKISYLDNFNMAYYSALLMHHYHNHPVLITFYELIFIVTKPVCSNPDFDDETKEKMNRRKIIRNRLHLWVFLTRNPSLCQYRVSQNPPAIEGEGDSNNDDSEDENGDTLNHKQNDKTNHIQLNGKHEEDKLEYNGKSYENGTKHDDTNSSDSNGENNDHQPADKYDSLDPNSEFEPRINNSVYSEDDMIKTK